MFAHANFDQITTADAALSNARVFRALKHLPPSAVRRTILAATFLETWLRWPLATLKLGDSIDATLAAVDRDGSRFGLDAGVKRQIKRRLLYDQLPDAIAFMSALDDNTSRARAMTVTDTEILDHQCESGPGAIVAGFRTGPYSAFPWALAAASGDRPVTMIVSYEGLAEIGRKLGQTFIPTLNKRVTFVSSQDPTVLAHSLAVLKTGGIVATLLELSPVEFARKTTVDFLDWRIDVPYGLSYLSAATSRPVVPAAITQRKGTRFRLRFHEPIPAPARNPESMQAQTQLLYSQLDRHVRRFPAQWPGWLILDSNMGIQLPIAGGQPLAAPF